MGRETGQFETETRRKSPDPVARRHKRLRTLAIVLLAAWIYWWAASLSQGKLLGGQATWIPVWSYLGLDFLYNYSAVQLLTEGGNPYVYFGHEFGERYGYPPLTLLTFLWTAPLGPKAAVLIWTIVIAAIVIYGVQVANRSREQVGLKKLYLPLATAAVLFSFPVMFALERGQCDCLVLLLAIVAAIALWRRGSWSEVLAGVALGAAVWIKIYPIFALPALLAMRAYRGFAAAVLTFILIGVVPLEATRQWMEAQKSGQVDRVRVMQQVKAWLAGEPPSQEIYRSFSGLVPDSHSVSHAWLGFWLDCGVPWLASIPGVIGAGLILVPILAWGSWAVFRSRAPKALAYPYLLWVLAIGTFWMPISYDYNLLYLPLMIIAVWDYGDYYRRQLLVAMLLPWWQPFALPIDAAPMLVLKLLGLVGATWMLVCRSKEIAPVSPTPARVLT